MTTASVARGDVEVVGTRVHQARVLRGLTVANLAAAIGETAHRVNELERSATTWATARELTALTVHTGVSTRFLRSTPTSRVTPSEVMCCPAAAGTGGGQEYAAVFAALAGDLLNDLDTRTLLPPVMIPSARRRHEQAIVDLARNVREAMGLRCDEPVDDLMYEVERIGVPIIVRPRELADPIDPCVAIVPCGPAPGFATWVGAYRERPLIVVDESVSWERTRFTVAHLLGHLVLHSHLPGCLGATHERDANRFAVEFLAPRHALAAHLPRSLPLLNLLPLKDVWGLSLSALIDHLTQNGLIDSRHADMLHRHLTAGSNPATGQPWSVTEPGWNDRHVEQPRLISKWAELCCGCASPALVAARTSTVLPLDVVKSILATQRSAPPPRPPTRPPHAAHREPSGAVVVELESAARTRLATRTPESSPAQGQSVTVTKEPCVSEGQEDD